MKFTDFSEFKNKFNKFISLAKKGENIIIMQSGKPILSMSGITKDEIEDFLLAKYYLLDKKGRSLGASTKFYSHKEVKKRLGF